VAARKRKSRSVVVRERPAAEYLAGRILLDTHTWLWWQGGDRRLGPIARRTIERAPEVYFSAASAWEIVIKSAIGKLTLPPHDSLQSEVERDGFHALPVTVAHAQAVLQLPHLHRDPFDRLLVAQALQEELVIVTHDAAIQRYEVPVLAAGE
jgi:PIN domain nuclease of toxin-antitoxin system